jgi:hypothetical protein
LTDRRVIRSTIANLIIASLLAVFPLQSWLSRRQRPSPPIDRSTRQRSGRTSNLRAPSVRLTISSTIRHRGAEGPDPLDPLAGVAAVRPDLPEPAEPVSDPLQDPLRPVAIRHVGRGHHHGQDQSERVHESVPRAAVDLLTAVVTVWSPVRSSGPSDCRGGRRWAAAACPAARRAGGPGCRPSSPAGSTRTRCGPAAGRGEHPPLSAGADDVQQTVDDLAVLGFGGSAPGLGGAEEAGGLGPLDVGQVGLVAWACDRTSRLSRLFRHTLSRSRVTLQSSCQSDLPACGVVGVVAELVLRVHRRSSPEVGWSPIRRYTRWVRSFSRLLPLITRHESVVLILPRIRAKSSLSSLRSHHASNRLKKNRYT